MVNPHDIGKTTSPHAVKVETETASALLPAWLLSDLRSDHAGETGAVAIYAGILAVTRDQHVARFATCHMQMEREHLRLIEGVLPPAYASILLPLWRIAGFLTGVIPALFGRRSVFATIGAVENFVDQHYAAQIDRLTRTGRHGAVLKLLERCRQDERAIGMRHRRHSTRPPVRFCDSGVGWSAQVRPSP